MIYDLNPFNLIYHYTNIYHCPIFQMQIMKENETPVARPRTGDKGNWRRKHIVGRSANIEMDLLDARFTSKKTSYLYSLEHVPSTPGI